MREHGLRVGTDTRPHALMLRQWADRKSSHPRAVGGRRVAWVLSDRYRTYVALFTVGVAPIRGFRRCNLGLRRATRYARQVRCALRLSRGELAKAVWEGRNRVSGCRSRRDCTSVTFWFDVCLSLVCIRSWRGRRKLSFGQLTEYEARSRCGDSSAGTDELWW
jgi:hypothetical protein